jgi:hypothetical protein
MVSFLLFSLAASAPVVLVGPSGIIATDVIKNVDTGMDVKAILVGPSGIIANGNVGSSGGEQSQSQFKQGQFDLARSNVKSSIANSNWPTTEDAKSALANSNRPALGPSGRYQSESNDIAKSNYATQHYFKSPMDNSNRPALGPSGRYQIQSEINSQFESTQQQQGGISESMGKHLASPDTQGGDVKFILVGPQGGVLAAAYRDELMDLSRRDGYGHYY